MNLRLIRKIATAATLLPILCALAVTTTAQNPTSGAGASAQSAQKLPIWAYPVPFAQGGPAPDNKTLQHVPGSKAGYTKAYIADLFSVADWFPDAHPPMPEVVSHGRKPAVFACGYCHLPNGQRRPENASIAGLPVDYIVQQMANFKNGLRKSSEPQMLSTAYMIKVAKAATDDEVREAAAYFSSIKLKPWIRVVETKTVPKTKVAGGMLILAKGGGAEPIGQRIIETPENQARVELRDSTSGFIAYVPEGSLQNGKDLVTTGGGGKTMPCTLCHGPDLKGVGNIPSIAGRSPSQMVRQIIDIQTGARNGPQEVLMKPVVSKLTNDDIVAITAYLASLTP